MRIVFALLLGFALLTRVGLGQAAPGFVFTPGHEYSYQIVVDRQWRNNNNLNNWIGEMKIWPIKKEADGEVLVRARIAMNPDEPDTVWQRDNTVAWAEFTVGPKGTSDYRFLPRGDEAQMIRPAFPLPPVRKTNWSFTEGDGAESTYHFSPGSDWQSSPWEIDAEPNDARRQYWKGRYADHFTYDSKNGRLLKWRRDGNYESGPFVWSTTIANFETEHGLSAGEQAKILHDSELLVGDFRELECLDDEPQGPNDDAETFRQRVDAFQAKWAGLAQNIQNPAFQEDVLNVRPDFTDLLKRAQVGRDREQALIDKPAPDWTATDSAGQAHSLKDYREKIVLLDFWTRSDEDCLVSAPFVNKIVEDYAGKPVAVIGVNENDAPEAMQTAVKYLRMENLQLVWGAMWRPYRLFDVPTFVLIDREGMLRAKYFGWNESMDKTLRGGIDRLLQAK